MNTKFFSKLSRTNEPSLFNQQTTMNVPGPTDCKLCFVKIAFGEAPNRAFVWMPVRFQASRPCHRTNRLQLSIQPHRRALPFATIPRGKIIQQKYQANENTKHHRESTGG